MAKKHKRKKMAKPPASIKPEVEKRVFRAKKDPGYLVFFILLASAVIALSAWKEDATWIIYALATIIVCMIFKIIFFTTYAFKEEGLRVTIGIRSPLILYKKITEVSRATKLLTASAVSFKCIRIQYGKRSFAFVAPKEEEAFLDILREKCPGAGFFL